MQSLSLPWKSLARILCSEPADGGPIETLAALGKQAQKSIMQQASERHGNAKTLGRGQREPDVLESEGCSKSRRLELALGDEVAVGFVYRYVEHRGGKEFNVRARVDPGLTDERNRFAEGLDGGSQQKIAAELDEIRRRRLGTDRKCFLPHGAEQRLTRLDRRGIARADDEQLGRSRHVRSPKHRCCCVALSGLGVRLRQPLRECDTDGAHGKMDRAFAKLGGETSLSQGDG